MTNTVILGAAGMLGRKLADRLAREGTLGGNHISRLTLVDVVDAAAPAGADTIVADLGDPDVPRAVVASGPDVVFHLAAVVSGEAEVDFEKGYRVNVDATRTLFDAIRAADGYCPRLVFSSSIAVFGPPLPDTIGDDHAPAPATSYGTEKALAELLLSDYSRRGFFDGIAIRLPTICVRPGAPNRATSGFFSSIIREPLNGHEAVLPVTESVRHWFASPRSAVGFLVHAAELEEAALGTRRCVTMPGVSATVGEQIEALRRVAGDEAVRLIRREPDETVMRIVSGWPGCFDTRCAHELGFHAESSFDEIVRAYVEDELGTGAAA
jgi:nucleoside-diphosphate-sugar epimerase